MSHSDRSGASPWYDDALYRELPARAVLRTVRKRPQTCRWCHSTIEVLERYMDANSRGWAICGACTVASGAPDPRDPRVFVDTFIRREPAPPAVAELGDGHCWIWQRALTTAGYGKGLAPYATAHRWVYELLVGPIPPGLHLDHLCSCRPCVAPHHLEPVTATENFRRCKESHARAVRAIAEARTHCGSGHEWTPENTYRPPSGGRYCRECMKKRGLAYYYRTKDRAGVRRGA